MRNKTVVRAIGWSSLGFVAAQDPKPWLRARFASDVGDAVLHAAGALTGRFRRGRTLLVAAGAAGVAAVDFALLTRHRKP